MDDKIKMPRGHDPHRSHLFGKLPTELRLKIYHKCTQQSLARLEATCHHVRDEIEPASQKAKSVWGRQFQQRVNCRELQGLWFTQQYAAELLEQPMSAKMRCEALQNRCRKSLEDITRHLKYQEDYQTYQLLMMGIGSPEALAERGRAAALYTPVPRRPQ